MKSKAVRLNFSLMVLATLALTLSACSKPVNETHYLAHDFFVTVLPKGEERKVAAKPAPITTRAECEAALTKAVCETNAGTQQIEMNYNSVKCSADGAKYVPALMLIFDEMPEKMRPSLCSLDRIFLSDAIASTAFASSVTDFMGRRIGGYVGMRRGTFLQQPTSQALVTWKEQLAFGGSTQFLSNDPKLVQLNYNLKLTAMKTDGLFYVLMHELGHLIDFNNHVNSSSGRPTQWSQQSWSGSSPLAQATFFRRDDFCFYDCRRFLNPADAKDIYTSLQKSAFISAYAATTPWEDFAEFWAWHLMIAYKQPNFQITVPGEAVLNMNPIFTENSQIKAKLDFVDSLWNSPDLQIDNRVDGTN